MVTREMNADYHDLIKQFEALTGVSALLNTSFNLHGKPIVRSPEDALYVIENSDLDAQVVEKTIISKKG
jgi:carbamoyltransferase